MATLAGLARLPFAGKSQGVGKPKSGGPARLNRSDKNFGPIFFWDVPVSIVRFQNANRVSHAATIGPFRLAPRNWIPHDMAALRLCVDCAGRGALAAVFSGNIARRFSRVRH